MSALTIVFGSVSQRLNIAGDVRRALVDSSAKVAILMGRAADEATLAEVAKHATAMYGNDHVLMTYDRTAASIRGSVAGKLNKDQNGKTRTAVKFAPITAEDSDGKTVVGYAVLPASAFDSIK